jgi:hypothetical protein
MRSEELHNLGFLPNMVRIFKLRRVRWVGYVARMQKKRNVYRVFMWESQKERDH